VWGLRGGEREGGEGRRTGDGVVAAVFGADAAVAVAVEAGHWFLGEEGEGFFEDWIGGGGALVFGSWRVLGFDSGGEGFVAVVLRSWFSRGGG